MKQENGPRRKRDCSPQGGPRMGMAVVVRPGKSQMSQKSYSILATGAASEEANRAREGHCRQEQGKQREG